MKRTLKFLLVIYLVFTITTPLYLSASVQPKPAAQSCLTPDEVYAMSDDEVKTMRDDLFGRGFDNLSNDERYNAVMLDYYSDWTDTAVRPRIDYSWERPVVGLGSFTPSYYPLNKMVQEDLNGDGRKERITVIASEDGELNGVTLKINNLRIDCGYSGENLVNGFAVIDIDHDDSFKEVVISDVGSSDDDSSNFYTFDGEKIIYMNEGSGIGGLYTYIHNGSRGEITTLRRADILQTWWYPIRYELTDGHLLRAVEEPLYKVHYDVFVLTDVPLYRSQSDKSPNMSAEKGTTVTFTALDDIEWVQVRLPDGQKGWLKVKDFNTLTVNGEEVSAQDVFFNLYTAD